MTTPLTGEQQAARLRIARAHREHERHYATRSLQQATELRQWAAALSALGRHWQQDAGRAEAAEDATDYTLPEYRAAGADDLNQPVATATAGILFMEGEHEPYEVGELRRRLEELSEFFAFVARWTGEKMDAGWPREMALPAAGLGAAAFHRFRALQHTTLHASAAGVVGRLLRAAVRALDARPLDPAGVREDPRSAGQLVQVAGWLIEEAAAVLVGGAAELARSDADWTSYIDALESPPPAQPAT